MLKPGDVINLECQVNYTTFSLSESELNTIFDLPSVTQPHLSPLEVQNKFLSEFAIPYPSDLHPRKCVHFVLPLPGSQRKSYLD